MSLRVFLYYTCVKTPIIVGNVYKIALLQDQRTRFFTEFSGNFPGIFLQDLSRHPIYFSTFFPSLVAVSRDSESRQVFSLRRIRGDCTNRSLSICVTRLFWKDRPHSRTWGRRRGVAQDNDDHEDDPYETAHVRWMLNVVAQGRAVRVVRARCDRSGVNWATCESGRQFVRLRYLTRGDRINPLPRCRWRVYVAAIRITIRILNVSIAAREYPCVPICGTFSKRFKSSNKRDMYGLQKLRNI